MKALYLVLVLALILCLPLAAQTARLSYGTKAGLNLGMHYGTKVDDGLYQVSVGMRPGFIGGAFLDMEILPQLSLGYELLYVQKGSRETIRVLQIDGEELGKPAEVKVEYDLDYMELPILLKVRTLDRGKLSMQALTGTAMGLKLRSAHRLDGFVYLPSGGGYDEIPISESSRLEEVNLFDFSFVYGTLLEYRAAVDISLELRFTLGWDYLTLPTFSLAEPVELRNQSYSAILGIRF